MVWHLASQGKSAEEIAEELARHPNGIGQKYAGRLQAEVNRSYDKWQTHKRAAATGSPAAGGAPWPQIRIIPGEIPRVVDRSRRRPVAARPRDLSARRPGRAAGAHQVQGQQETRHAGMAAGPGHAAVPGRHADLRRPVPEARWPLEEVGHNRRTGQGRRDLSGATRTVETAGADRNHPYAVPAGRRLDLRATRL